MLNVQVIGNLGKDAEVINTKDGKSFVSICVAHSHRYKKNGQVISETIWIDGNINWICNNLLQYMTKGTKVYISGELVPKVYHSQDRSYLNLTVLVDRLELCGIKSYTSTDQALDINDNNDKPF